jgi:16S rRNA (guanine966-N2)-methyltransferase
MLCAFPMRIIAGKYKGYQFKTYSGSNTRPTTDLAKESIFNTLQNITGIEGKKVLDLFAGTGNVGIEFLSRGASSLVSIDSNMANIRFMQEIEKQLDIKDWNILKTDALQYLKDSKDDFDIIFADPPYNYPQFHQLIGLVTNSTGFQSNNTMFILEHSDKLVFASTYLLNQKQYGNTCFSIFMAQ